MPYAREHPGAYPRRILLAVTGLPPQIVTETLYALAVAPAPGARAFVPSEIHLITTRSGAEKARLALLSDEPGWFHRLCRDYALPPIDFAAEHIHVLADADDIRSPDDNRCAADGISELAGGRLADAASARITLAELPFVSLRHGLPEALLTGHASYNEAVAAARLALAPAQLAIDLAGRRIQAAGKVFALPPAELALLSVFARRLVRGEPPLPAPPKDVPDPEWRQRYRTELHLIDGSFRDHEKTEAALKKGMDGGYFSTHLSKLRRLIERQLGAAARPYLISDGGKRPHRYCLDLPPSAVRYDAIDAAGAEGGD